MEVHQSGHSGDETPVHGGRPATQAGDRRGAPDARPSSTWAAGGLGCAAAVVFAGVAGWVVAGIMPRGAVTSAEALGLLLGTLLLGLVLGYVMASRWAMLVGPLTFLAVFEIGRVPVPGPTMGAVHLGSQFGVLAFLLGRGVFALLSVVPMLVGVNLGVVASGERRLRRACGPRRLTRVIGWSVTVVAAASLGVLGLLIARPASTPPILGPDGKPLPGSLATLERVHIGDTEQWIVIRAARPDNPVLLYLSGGPGQSDLPYSRVLLGDLARDFVVIAWDQRGTGKSYPALDPSDTLTPDRAVRDVIALTQKLRKRFGAAKIYLLGESWGSTLGVLAVQRRPDLYYAFIGSGQLVSQRETDARLYRDVLDYARSSGDDSLLRRIKGFGAPPYGSVFAYGAVMAFYDQLAGAYAPPAAFTDRLASAHLGFLGVRGSEYRWIEKVNVVRGLIDMFSVLYPQLQTIDFRRDVPRLDVPIYLFDGGHELGARRDLALQWFAQVDAPLKRLYSFPDAGHAVAFEHFGDLRRILADVVVPETYTRP
ncbi:MAG: alpha/beta fold hydrolase [Deinococcales bacterium]